MGLTDKVNLLATNIKQGVRSTTYNGVCLVLRLLTAFVLGFTVGTIVQELGQTGEFARVFSGVVIGGIFLRFSSKWSLGNILIFDLICVLVAQLLKMYIYLAPGA